MHLVKFNGNKLSSIPKSILISSIVTNQASSPLISLNNANVGGNDRENAIAINSVVENKEMGELNEDAKVGLKIQSNIATIVLAFYWLTTATSTLVSDFFVLVFICHLFAFVCDCKLLFFQA